MNIVIVGGGFTGVQVAKNLLDEKNKVAIVENDEDTARHISNQVDCTVVLADGNNLETLEDAGIAKVDALICVTPSDEVNMITCSLVDAVYPDILKIARVRNYAYYVNTASAVKKHANSFGEGKRRPLYGINYMMFDNPRSLEGRQPYIGVNMMSCLTARGLLSLLVVDSPIHEQIEYVLTHIAINVACIVNDVFNRGGAVLGSKVSKRFVYDDETIEKIYTEINVALNWLKHLPQKDFTLVDIPKFKKKYRSIAKTVNCSMNMLKKQNKIDRIIYTENDLNQIAIAINIIQDVLNILGIKTRNFWRGVNQNKNGKQIYSEEDLNQLS